MRFETPTESQVDFRYRSSCYRFRVRGGQDDKGYPTARIICLVKADPEDETFKPPHALTVARKTKETRGTPGHSGVVDSFYLSIDGHWALDSAEQGFFYLITGEKA